MERETELTHGNETADGNKKELGNANSELQQEDSFLLRLLIYLLSFFTQLVVWHNAVFSSNGSETSEQRRDDAVFSAVASEIPEEREIEVNGIMALELIESFYELESYSPNGPMIYRKTLKQRNDIMEALRDASAIIIGVCGAENATIVDLVEKVTRRVHRDNLFDKVIRVSLTGKPNLKRIQGEVAAALSFLMEEKSEAKRAALLRDRIKIEQKILIILQDLKKGLDLGKLGIPCGDDHNGCKILLTSTSQEILSNRMHANRVFEAT